MKKLVFILILIPYLGLTQTLTIIEDNYKVFDNDIFFDSCEYKSTLFKEVPPKKDLFSPEVKAFLKKYADYHLAEVAKGRMFYFFEQQGVERSQWDNYIFFIHGYYASYSYNITTDLKGKQLIIQRTRGINTMLLLKLINE